MAAERGLGLDVTFFTGHMSGPNWAPSWLLGGDEPVPDGRQVVSGADQDAGRYRNPYTDPVALDAAELQLREVVGRLRDHPGVWAWNLGNEPDNFALPPDDEAGAGWAARMFAAIRELDPERHRTVGLHAPSLTTRNHLRADQVFADADFAVMHAYPIYANFGVDALDPDIGALRHRADRGAFRPAHDDGGVRRLHRAAGLGDGQLALADEVPHVRARSCSRRRCSPSTSPRSCRDSSRSAPPEPWCGASPTTTRTCGAVRRVTTSWHERHFGLVRPDGSLKPHAEVMREFIAGGPVIREPSRALAHRARQRGLLRGSRPPPCRPVRSLQGRAR